MLGAKNSSSLCHGLGVRVGAYLPHSRQAVCNSILTFTSCFQRASRSAAGEKLCPSQIFSEYAHSPELAHGLHFQKCQSISFLSLSCQAFWLICYLPNCFLSPQAAVAITLACKRFSMSAPRKAAFDNRPVLT